MQQGPKGNSKEISLILYWIRQTNTLGYIKITNMRSIVQERKIYKSLTFLDILHLYHSHKHFYALLMKIYGVEKHASNIFFPTSV